VRTSAQRRAENEAQFRQLNERVARKAHALSFGDQRVPFLCECADTGCTELITLTQTQYRQVRNHPRRFVIFPGHQSPADQVVTEFEGFMVVEKTGEEGEVVEELDPRNAASNDTG
jgi:hypothetical protein